MTVAWGVVWVVSALGGMTGLVALIKSGADRRKIITDATKAGADAAAVLSTTAIGLVGPLRAQIADLTAEVTSLKTQLNELTARMAETERRAAEAEMRLRQLGAT